MVPPGAAAHSPIAPAASLHLPAAGAAECTLSSVHRHAATLRVRQDDRGATASMRSRRTRHCRFPATARIGNRPACGTIPYPAVVADAVCRQIVRRRSGLYGPLRKTGEGGWRPMADAAQIAREGGPADTETASPPRVPACLAGGLRLMGRTRGRGRCPNILIRGYNRDA